jgi:hypothetical protein
LYANLIREGAINPKTDKRFVIGDVPEVIRAEVESILAGDESAE